VLFRSIGNMKISQVICKLTLNKKPTILKVYLRQCL